QMVMIQPKFADDYETNQPAQKFWQKIDKVMGKLAGAVALVQNRDFELEHEQRHHNGEHAVAERFDSAKTEFSLRKALQQIHVVTAPPRESDAACDAQTARAAPIQCR